MAGVSLGGTHAWLCAAIDGRVAAVAPLLGVQSFQWAISNDAIHGRVESLENAFKQICDDCGKAGPQPPSRCSTKHAPCSRPQATAISRPYHR